MYKVAVIGIAAAFWGMTLKKDRGEYTLLIGIAAGLLIFGYSLLQLSAIVEFIREVMEQLPIEQSCIRQLLKMLGITYIAEFASNLCKDAGYHSLSGQIEIFAKMAIVALSIPGLRMFLQVVELYI